MRLITLTFLAIFLAACATANYYSQALNSWQGTHIEDLIRTWGVPDRMINMPDGTTYYVYTSESYQSTPPTLTPGYATYTNSAGKPVMSTIMFPTPPTTFLLQCTTWFQVNNQHVIVSAHAKGNYCFADNMQIRNLENPLRPVNSK
jgi:hypothetical protein